MSDTPRAKDWTIMTTSGMFEAHKCEGWMVEGNTLIFYNHKGDRDRDKARCIRMFSMHNVICWEEK